MQDRKKEMIPHISYDLDGDGYVGGRDLVIAKHFDQDRDGRLNTAEKANAMAALKEGYENQFVWGIEQSVPSNLHRLMQKRGKVIHGEDFLVLRDTYPVHPLTTKQVDTHTQKELFVKRKIANISDLDAQKKRWDDANPSHVEQKQIKSEFHVENPAHTSMKAMKEQKKIE